MALQAPNAPQSSEDTSFAIKTRVRAIMSELKVSTTTRELTEAIISSESDWQNVTGITGDMGLMQFSSSTWNWVCEGDPFNIEDNINCGIKEIEKNALYRWSASRESREKYIGWYDKLSSTTQQFVLKQDILCSCVLYLRDRLNFPPIRNFGELNPNSMPRIGTIALFYYPIGGHHGGEVVKVNYKGFYVNDANFRKCAETRYRFISWIDWLRVGRGFYSP